jgi:hypothetical protein
MTKKPNLKHNNTEVLKSTTPLTPAAARMAAHNAAR